MSGKQAAAQGQRPSQYYPAFFESLPSLQDKTVVITGCSRGLGYVTALTVAQKGGSVIMLNRPSERSQQVLEQLQKSTNQEGNTKQRHHAIDCDLLSFESVRQACQKVEDLTRETGINVLCYNAGIMLQPDEASQDGYDITASTNMLSHFLITKQLFPSLQKASDKNKKSPSRIVTMSSASGYGGPPLDVRFFEQRGGSLGGAPASYQRYHQTKLANLLFTSALHDRFQLAQNNNTNILALACTPGVCGTDMFTHATTVMNGQPADTSMVPSVEDGVMAQLKCIFLADVTSGQLWGPGRNGEIVCTPIEPPLILVDETSKEQLWEACEKAVGKFDI